jgi:hypothetical protein
VSTTEALLDSVGPDAPVRQVLVGAFWTAVVLETKQTVSQAATFRQIPGKRLLTMAREG